MSSPTYTDFPKYLDTRTPVRAHPLGTVRHSDSHTHTARSAQGLVGTAGSLAAPLDLCPPAAPPDGPLLTSAGTLRPQCHSRRSRASAPASCRCHRDPRARGPRPPGVAPTPAGSGRGGRTLVRLWHRPRVPTHRPPPLGDAAERYGEGVSVSATSAAQGEAGGDRPKLKFYGGSLSLPTVRPCCEPGTCSEHRTENALLSHETRWGRGRSRDALLCLREEI